MMSQGLPTILGKLIASGVLAAVFIALFLKAPFLGQLDGEDDRSLIPATSPGNLRLSALQLESGILPPSSLPGLQDPSLSALQAGSDLFKGEFLQDGGVPGFSTGEHVVDGPCESAGRRYIESICPECEIQEGPAQPGQTTMLLWHKPGEKDGGIRSVSADCIASDGNNKAVVGSLSFGPETPQQGGNSQPMAADLVPLLPGAKRVSAMEMGGWLAIMDEVESPDRALDAMATALRQKGWQDVEGQPANGVGSIKEQRVFSRAGYGTCVIYLNRDGGSVQLVTVVST